jgi:glutathione peroxidase
MFNSILLLSIIMQIPDSIYSFSANSIDGRTIRMEDYRGKVLLIVNTASQCGYTPQYADLQKLYTDLEKRGFVVLGFPCNQFGEQEPGSDAEIHSFCQQYFGVTFPLFAKIDVNGDNAHPLFQFLKSTVPGILGTEAIKWNFTKFLVGKDGRVLGRFGSSTKPDDIREEIEGALGKGN